MYLWHVVAGVEPATLWVDSAVLSHVVLHKVSGHRLDEVESFLFHEGGHVVATVQL